MEKILVTGGAGFVGSVLMNHLLQEGYRVKGLDNLMYDQTSHIPLFINKNFEFIKSDIRSKRTVREALRDADMIIHLAAIVGAPACLVNPRLARETNVLGSRNVNQLRSKTQALIYASTGSVYGALEKICTEKSPTKPLSVYGKTKLIAEKEILEKGNSTALRFATGFGISHRLCLDFLLINDFVYQACATKQLIVYEKHARRTFIHVQDMARSYLFTLQNFKKMNGEAFNVGSEKMNYTKGEVALKIREKIPFYLYFAEIGEDEDKRDYEVSYEKIRKLGFETKVSLDEGIEELVKAFRAYPFKTAQSQLIK